ncbi:MAG: DUF3343 domain-containing protein [Anaerovoracaceae bacterium]
MADIRIPFNSYSGAAQARDLLDHNHIQSRIVRTPAGPRSSCGYSLKVRDRDENSARYLMSVHGYSNRR